MVEDTEYRIETIANAFVIIKSTEPVEKDKYDGYTYTKMAFLSWDDVLQYLGENPLSISVSEGSTT